VVVWKPCKQRVRCGARVCARFNLLPACKKGRPRRRRPGRTNEQPARQARGTDGEIGGVRERDTGEKKDGRCNGDGARV